MDLVLNSSIERARQEWGAEFHENYAAAQPWLYAGDDGTAIVIPSADKVGRLFPLYAAVRAQVVLQALYDAVVGAIAEQHHADVLYDAIRAAPEKNGKPGDEPVNRWFCPDADAPRLPLCWDETKMTLGEIMA